MIPLAGLIGLVYSRLLSLSDDSAIVVTYYVMSVSVFMYIFIAYVYGTCFENVALATELASTMVIDKDLDYIQR